MSYWDKLVNIEALVGQKIRRVIGLSCGSDSIIFEMEDVSSYKMYHEQDCCESVQLEDFDLTGELSGLVLSAEESTSDYKAEDGWTESGTWTFYKIKTERGDVWLRWLGTSNGYYSEDVSLIEVPAEVCE